MSEEGDSAGLSSCSGGLRPLVELCVEPAGLCGRCTGVAVPLRTGDRDQDHPQRKETQKSKMAVWGGLTNSCEKKRSEKHALEHGLQYWWCTGSLWNLPGPGKADSQPPQLQGSPRATSTGFDRCSLHPGRPLRCLCDLPSCRFHFFRISAQVPHYQGGLLPPPQHTPSLFFSLLALYHYHNLILLLLLLLSRFSRVRLCATP